MKESPQIDELLTRLPAVLWLVNRDLRITFFTGGAIEPLGIKAEDLLGLHIFEALGVNDPGDPGAREHLDALQEISSSYYKEWHGRHFQCRVTPLHDSSGEIVGAAGVALDNTERIKSEEALRRSEQQLRLAEELTRTGSAERDLLTDEVRWSDGLYRIFGLDPNVVQPALETILAHTEPEDRKVVEGIVGQTRSGLDHFSYDMRIRRADGERRFLHVKGTVEGQRALSTVRDMTEEYERERELLAAKQRFELVSRATSDIVWDWDLESGEVWRGRGSDRLTGCLAETNPSDELWISNIHSDDRDRVQRGVRDALQSSDKLWTDRYCLKCVDGTILHVIDRAFIIRDESGMPTRMVGAMTDVSREREAEKEAQNSERWFRTLIEHASDAISVIDLGGTILYKSPSVERILGFKPSELIGRNVFELVHSEDRAAVEASFRVVVREETTCKPFELRFHHKNGSWRLIETVLSPARDPDGHKIVISNYRDVTEARHLRRQYEESERIAALGRVASSMAHEFNNVLMGIQPFVEVVTRSSDPKQLANAASQIAASIRRGKNVTDQVLQFTRGQRKVLGPVRVLSWLRTQLAEIRAITPETIHLDLSLPDEDLWVTGNTEQLQQVLINLVLNAIEAMPEGGELQIAAEQAGQATWSFGHVPDHESMVHLSVTDSGIGIEPEFHGKIFEPLFTTGKSHGTGLGLAVTRQIVTAHDGYLFLESEPGQGSTFHVFLPVSAARPEEMTFFEDVRLDERIRRILLIEDEDTIAEGLRILFDMVGVEVERASTGREGVEMARSSRPDAIILDVGLPDIDGTEVFEQIRMTGSDISIVFATGHADELRLRDLLQRRHTSFVEKPFELDDLISVLNATFRDEELSD